MNAATSDVSFSSAVVRRLAQLGPAAVVVTLLLVAFWGSHLLSPGGESESSTEESSAPSAAAEVNRVSLSENKMAAAGITVVQAVVREVRAEITVPGVLQYDETRHLELKAPADCVVTRVAVRPGQAVEQGDLLAQLRSDQVGLAHVEVERSESRWRLAQMQHDRARETHENVEQLLALLRQHPSLSTVEQQFEGKRLGKHRDDLLTAYSQYMLADTVENRTRSLDERGVVAGRLMEERTSRRQVASASYQSTVEQSQFDAEHDWLEATAELDLAQRDLSVSRERLSLLLGPYATEESAGAPSEFALHAPFRGRVGDGAAVTAGRYLADEPLFVLADTSTLWVAADIRQRTWQALGAVEDQELSLAVPAFPAETFPARTLFVGASVAPDSRSVPLVAELDNRGNRFRPGMFAWITVPSGPSRKTLVVPQTALQFHERQAFVFLQESERTFRRVRVVTGIQAGEWIEIKEGISEADPVVDAGAFYLKSELLLEGEAD